MRSLLLALTLACGVAAAEAPPGPSAPPAAALAAPAAPDPAAERVAAGRAVAEALREMRLATERLRDVTYTLHRTEYADGPRPPETISVKLRNARRAVYLRWTGPARHGQEVIWREGWNGGRLRAHRGSFPDITVNLSPTSSLAMHRTRHPVTEIGFEFIVSVLERDLAASAAAPGCLLRAGPVGAEDVAGAPARCFEVETDATRCPALYARRARFCMGEATRLPSRVQVWNLADGEVRLVEDLAYEGLRLDAGLTDADFDPDRYDF